MLAKKKNNQIKDLLPDNRLKSISLLVNSDEEEILKRFMSGYTPEMILEELFQIHIHALNSSDSDGIDKLDRSNQASLIKMLIDISNILLKKINSQNVN